MAFYYVSREGTIRLGRVHGPNEIKLATGEVLPDPPPGEMFATEKSASRFSELVKELGDFEAAKKAHIEWVRRRGYESE